MKNLIFRNIFLQRNSIKWIIGYMIISFLIIDDFISNNGLFFIIIPSMTYISYFTIEQLENYYKNGTILNSMPVTRRNIVISKYVSVLIMYVINLLIGLAVFFIFRTCNIISYELDNITNGVVLSLSISMIISGIGIPSILKFNPWLSKIINVVIFILVLNVLIPIKNSINLNTLAVEGIIAFLISSIIFISSLFISIKIYKNKEF